MKKKIQLLFVIAVVCVMAVPIAFFNWNGTASLKENRTLAAFPARTAGAVFFLELDRYIDDRFGVREKLFSLASHVRYGLLRGTVMNDKAMLGKDGWWFYIDARDGANLEDFYKRNLMSDERLGEFKTQVERVMDWCDRNGIKAMFIIAPNKHSVYEEHIPFAPRPHGPTRADQLCAVFKSLGADYVFPRDYLVSKKGEGHPLPLYWETDIHWNPLGAFYAADEIVPRIKRLFPNADFPRIDYESETLVSAVPGDIPPMLGLERPNVAYTAIPKDWRKLSSFYSYEKPDMSGVGGSYDDFHGSLRDVLHDVNGMVTKGANPSLPRALVFRDSFFRALEPFISPLFSETEYVWKQFRADDAERVLTYKPDIIIFESVERYAPDIVRFD